MLAIDVVEILYSIWLQSGSSTESSRSVVSDLLDYLNESWTQFHATGMCIRLSGTSLFFFWLDFGLIGACLFLPKFA